MPISPIFKIQVEQDIERCEGQKTVTSSEKLYVELVNRYRTLIENFMRKLPKVRKPPTSICGADYRPELQLIASKLRIYLFAQERGGSEMADNPMKQKVDEFVCRGVDIGKVEFHPASEGYPFSYVSGPLYDTWMGEINIFNERHLKEHPLHDSIATTYSRYRKDSSSYDEMMGHLRALLADVEFF